MRVPRILRRNSPPELSFRFSGHRRHFPPDLCRCARMRQVWQPSKINGRGPLLEEFGRGEHGASPVVSGPTGQGPAREGRMFQILPSAIAILETQFQGVGFPRQPVLLSSSPLRNKTSIFSACTRQVPTAVRPFGPSRASVPHSGQSPKIRTHYSCFQNITFTRKRAVANVSFSNFKMRIYPEALHAGVIYTREVYIFWPARGNATAF